jgi:hypothetical protein
MLKDLISFLINYNNKMSANFGMMDEGYFVSKSEIFKWINEVIGRDLKSIDHLGRGDIYC